MNETRTENSNLLQLWEGIPSETPSLPLLFSEMPIHGMEQTSPQVDPEEWRSIPNFPRYQCSTLGRFRRSHNFKVLSGTVNHTGYIHIGLLKDGNQIWKLAHRVIAETFLVQPSPEHFIVNHKNYDRKDNRLVNLEWCTRSHNSKHGWARKIKSL